MSTEIIRNRVNEAPPSISLITYSYNQAQYLETTMRSVLAQNYPALEYGVVDGTSNDGTGNLLQRYRSYLAFSQTIPHRGPTNALINGFAITSGEIMGWLRSGDLLLPGALQAVSEFFASHPEVMAVYGDALWIDADGRCIRSQKEMPFNRFVFLYDHNFVPQSSMFWRRNLYDAVGGLDPSFTAAMDADLWDRFQQRTRIAHLNRYLSCMRVPTRQQPSIDEVVKRESTAVRMRHTRARALHQMLYPCAKALRIAMKGCNGGYHARVPDTHLSWLKEMARPTDWLEGRDEFARVLWI